METPADKCKLMSYKGAAQGTSSNENRHNQSQQHKINTSQTLQLNIHYQHQVRVTMDLAGQNVTTFQQLASWTLRQTAKHHCMHNKLAHTEKESNCSAVIYLVEFFQASMQPLYAQGSLPLARGTF